MASLTIEVPDDLARRLAGIAARRQTSVEDLAIEELRALAESQDQPSPGTPAARLRAMGNPPHLTAGDVAELEGAISAGRLSSREQNPLAG